MLDYGSCSVLEDDRAVETLEGAIAAKRLLLTPELSLCEKVPVKKSCATLLPHNHAAAARSNPPDVLHILLLGNLRFE